MSFEHAFGVARGEENVERKARGETFMVFWIHLHASAAKKERPGRPFEFFVREAKRHIEIGDSNRV